MFKILFLFCCWDWMKDEYTFRGGLKLSIKIKISWYIAFGEFSQEGGGLHTIFIKICWHWMEISYELKKENKAFYQSFIFNILKSNIYAWPTGGGRGTHTFIMIWYSVTTCKACEPPINVRKPILNNICCLIKLHGFLNFQHMKTPTI